MSHLTHPNTVKVMMYGELESGELYIVMEYLEGKTVRPPRPVESDPDALVEADAERRARGWWESASERTPGLTSVSAPVRRDERIVAAVCVAGPIERVATSAGLLWGQAVRDAALEIEKSLVVRSEW